MISDFGGDVGGGKTDPFRNTLGKKLRSKALPLKEEGLDLRGENRRVAPTMASWDVGIARGKNSSVKLVKGEINRGEVREVEVSEKSFN